MGMWIAIAIVLFVLGSMMALKPSGIDQRLDKLRMTARRLQLNPKLVTCPDWVKGKDNEYGRGMIGQYGLVLDNVKLPLTRYQVLDGQWRPASNASSDNNSLNNTLPVQANFSLDKEPLALPASIEPFVKALLVKSNSIIIYWEDIAYVRPATNPAYQQQAIESDLLIMKKNLEKWASQMQKSA
ncbi:hypothetical protein CXF58_12280 [Psychrobacter sp. Sarcosine-02u-2]|uniref:hypothetical protein n=1 Tax=Psychrobacter sp. Sarcosine-02u-2 TaxID=2058324 RepID=UPI000C7A875D|nr:hypothetical protein [Psychrobacter sp. Sarcosine-02u-2]PKG82978.1 hypothetical protein CXF58_12280 [Psychrobacter sp. Sarcosine-02u-2]